MNNNIPQTGGKDKVRPSPSQSATSYKVGTKKTGNDGLKWIVTETSNGVKRWKALNIDKTKTKTKSRSRSRSRSKSKNKSDSNVKCEVCPPKEKIDPKKEMTKKFNNLGVKTKSFVKKTQLSSKNKCYDIHDNGGRPFRVVCNNKGIRIYTYSNADEVETTDDLIYDKLLLKFTDFIGYWDGFDTSSWSTFHGNTLLVQETKHRYVWIGNDGIYRFEIDKDEEIYDFISPVGNSDVSYPIAYSQNYVYFMLNKDYVSKDSLKTDAIAINAEDMYSEYYGHIFPNKTLDKKRFKHIKILKKRL